MTTTTNLIAKAKRVMAELGDHSSNSSSLDLKAQASIKGLLDLIEAQAKQIEALQADAERYRWLREHCDSMILTPPLTVARVTGYGLEGWSGDDLNAAIDATRKGNV
jgi:hypothetical protein